MSEEAITAEEVVDDVAKDAPIVDLEAEARDMGWRPKDQFKGDEKDFIDAPEFVRRGKEIMPLLKADRNRLDARVKTLEKTLEKFADHHSKTEQRAYERALKDLEARQAEAVEANDGAAVREITKEIVDLTKDATKPKVTTDSDDGAEAFESWKSDNAWFEKDAGLRAAAIGIGEEIKNDFPDPIKQRAEIVKRVKAAFPEKFTNPRRQQAAAVEGVGSGPKSTGKSYADLPADAKKMCDEFVRDIKGFTREKFVKDYQF